MFKLYPTLNMNDMNNIICSDLKQILAEIVDCASPKLLSNKFQLICRILHTASHVISAMVITFDEFDPNL